MTALEKVEDGLNDNLWQDEDGNFYVGRPGQSAEDILTEVNAPRPEPAPPATVIPAVTLWERMTDVEAEQVNAAMATQPFRTRQIFLTANTFRSDHELWPLLVQMATDLFGDERAAELLMA
jgi:hypothetical protein